MVKLGDVASFVRGITFKPDDVIPVHSAGAVACMRTKNVQEQIDLSDVWGIPRSFVKRPDQFVREGDLLVSTANSWNLVGKCSWVPALPWPTTVGGFIAALRGGDRIDPRYLYHWFASSGVQVRVRNCARQTTNIANLSFDRCLDLTLPLPPLPEQKRIAAILDQTDDVRRKTSQADNRFSDLGSALFWDAFVSNGSKEWPTVRVDTLVNRSRGGMRTGPFGSQLLHAEFVDAGISVLGIDNAVSNEFRWAGRRFITPEKYSGLKRYKVYPGDVLITIMGTCGRCAIVPSDIGEAINTKHLCCITLDGEKCIPEYLYYYFLHHPEATKHLARQSKGAIMQGLNMGIIKDLPVVLPPISVQAEFARRIQGMSAEKGKIDAAKSAAEALFTSLQHRAFRGEL
ncbi:restriction endonuclease subunit S [Sphingomonas faeni]|uniref:restriction endonuclease subunit S n=1 Tax=Sphingomonas faeni TaxID=185950 RepID=UPI0033443A0C